MQSNAYLKYRALLFQVGLVCLADAVVGISYGALAVSLGFELWVPLSLSILVLAGASEFLFIGIVAAGGSAMTAAIAGLLVNSRLLAFGFSLDTQLGQGWRRYLGTHLMSDETLVFGISQKSDALNKKAYWLSGLGILCVWPLGVLFGGLIGSYIEDPKVLGLDAMFPAILIALVLPKFDTYKKWISALSGACLSVASTPFLPLGIPALVALLGIFVKRRKANG